MLFIVSTKKSPIHFNNENLKKKKQKSSRTVSHNETLVCYSRCFKLFKNFMYICMYIQKKGNNIGGNGDVLLLLIISKDIYIEER